MDPILFGLTAFLTVFTLNRPDTALSFSAFKTGKLYPSNCLNPFTHFPIP